MRVETVVRGFFPTPVVWVSVVFPDLVRVVTLVPLLVLRIVKDVPLFLAIIIPPNCFFAPFGPGELIDSDLESLVNGKR